MKRAISLLTMALLIGATGLTGCKKAPKNITPIPGQENMRLGGDTPGDMKQGSNNQRPISNDSGIGSRPLTSNPGDENSAVGSRRTGNENPEILQGQTVYFDFDKSAIKPSETAKLKAVAAYLKNTPTASLKIAGNCDERGTEEYNRSLGERRALAAMDYLVKQEGIDASRITTVSNGEDDPADPGHDEAAWSKNRRDQFIVILPK